MTSAPICLRVKGPFACFTWPEFHVERVSYPDHHAKRRARHSRSHPPGAGETCHGAGGAGNEARGLTKLHVCDFYAHTKNRPDGSVADESEWQPLREHLRNVGNLAESFASAFDLEAQTGVGGLLHNPARNRHNH